MLGLVSRVRRSGRAAIWALNAESDMGRPPAIPAERTTQIALSILAGEATGRLRGFSLSAVNREVRGSGRHARAVIPALAGQCETGPPAERAVAAAGAGRGPRRRSHARIGASGAGHRKVWAMTRRDGHLVSQATMLRLLRDKGLSCPPSISGSAASSPREARPRSRRIRPVRTKCRS